MRSELCKNTTTYLSRVFRHITGFFEYIWHIRYMSESFHKWYKKVKRQSTAFSFLVVRCFFFHFHNTLVRHGVAGSLCNMCFYIVSVYILWLHAVCVCEPVSIINVITAHTGSMNMQWRNPPISCDVTVQLIDVTPTVIQAGIPGRLSAFGWIRCCTDIFQDWACRAEERAGKCLKQGSLNYKYDLM